MGFMPFSVLGELGVEFQVFSLSTVREVYHCLPGLWDLCLEVCCQFNCINNSFENTSFLWRSSFPWGLWFQCIISVFLFILFGAHLDDWIWGVISFICFGKHFIFMSLNIASLSFSILSFWTSYWMYVGRYLSMFLQLSLVFSISLSLVLWPLWFLHICPPVYQLSPLLSFV